MKLLYYIVPLFLVSTYAHTMEQPSTSQPVTVQVACSCLDTCAAQLALDDREIQKYDYMTINTSFKMAKKALLQTASQPSSQILQGAQSHINAMRKVISESWELGNSSATVNFRIALNAQLNFFENSLRNPVQHNKKSLNQKFFNLFNFCTGFGVAGLGLYRIVKGNWSITEMSFNNPWLTFGAGSAIATTSFYHLYNNYKNH